ncbi:MAG: PHP domain-containing protein [Candidatus Eremiobacteraeota bacterium]|nr:PHP domain-containing protein [Candidatus Eremiobacteraeota bacterium]
MIDLHTHTSASDGILTPTELVARAGKLGVSILSVTDHDTISGLKEAMTAARGYGMEFIPGVELNTDVNRDEIHILGYFIDPEDESFCATLKELGLEREKRCLRMLDKLEEFNVSPGIERVRVFSKGESIGRPHIARAMLEMGIVSNFEEVFAKYIGSNAPCYVPRKKIKPKEAVKLILSAGGIPVLAHPGLMKDFDGKFPLLLSAGLMGIEAYYPRHSHLQIDYFVRVAKKHNLLVTAGTDYHGSRGGHSVYPGYPGVPKDVIKEIKRLVTIRRKDRG